MYNDNLVMPFKSNGEKKYMKLVPLQKEENKVVKCKLFVFNTKEDVANNNYSEQPREVLIQENDERINNSAQNKRQGRGTAILQAFSFIY